jgi:TonB family protein
MKVPVLILTILITASAGFAQLGDFSGAVVLKRGEPYYPADLVPNLPENRTIEVLARINERGEVFEDYIFVAKNCDGSANAIDEELQAAIEKAVRQTIFSPARRGGVPIISAFTLKFEFPKKEAPPKPIDPQPEEKKTEPSDSPRKGGVANGVALSLPKPKYPATARLFHVEGPARIQLSIDEQGNVTHVEGASGHPILLTAAADAACQAKFSPTLLSGVAVKVTGVITYNFVQ